MMDELLLFFIIPAPRNPAPDGPAAGLDERRAPWYCDHGVLSLSRRISSMACALAARAPAECDCLLTMGAAS